MVPQKKRSHVRPQVSYLYRALVLFALTMVVCSCCSLTNWKSWNQIESETLRTEIELSETLISDVRGLVVLVHGLNNSLAVWRPFSEFLNEKGYHVIAPRLAGHEIRALPSSVSVNSWLLNVEHALEQARVRWADKLIYGVGFSLGGAVLDAYASRSPESFEKLVLVAPAIHLTGLANSLRILRTLRLLGLSLPSFTPQKYRSRAWTSLESYNALFNLSDGSIDPASVAPCRQIWLSPRDGLIAYTESRNWAERNACSAADVEVVTPLAVAPAAHPIPVPDMLGETEWRRMTNQILEFFRR